VTLTAVNAISAMVAPVVLLTTGSLLANGLLVVYSAVNDRMREMTRERQEIRRGPGGELVQHVPALDQERLAEIEVQLPMMLRRHHLIRNAVLVIYAGIAVLGLSIIVIAVAVGEDSEGLGRAALGLVLAGTVVILTGLILAGLSLARSADAVTYAVEQARRLGLAVTLQARNRPDQFARRARIARPGRGRHDRRIGRDPRTAGVDMTGVPLKDCF
jgi:Protein of unknown function (DUF2721)